MGFKERSAKNEYQRAWAARNPDKIRAAQIKYWQKKQAQLDAANAAAKAQGSQEAAACDK